MSWFALPPVSLGSVAVITLADLRSERRLIIVVDDLAKVLTARLIEVPMGSSLAIRMAVSFVRSESSAAASSRAITSSGFPNESRRTGWTPDRLGCGSEKEVHGAEHPDGNCGDSRSRSGLKR